MVDIPSQQLNLAARLVVLEAAVGQLLRSGSSPSEIESEIRETANFYSNPLRDVLSKDDAEEFYRYIEEAIGRLFES